MMLCVLLQYMVLYQLLLAVLTNMTFFMDGSSISYRQVRICVNKIKTGSAKHMYMATLPHCLSCQKLCILLCTKDETWSCLAAW